MKKILLIIEDKRSVAKQLKRALSMEYEISVAYDAKQARSLLSSSTFPVTLLDLGLPPFPDEPIEGLKLLEEIPFIAPYTKVIVITENADKGNAVKAISLGAVDFFVKPVNIDQLRIILSRTFRIFELEEANRRQQEQQCREGMLCGMLGISPPMVKVFELIRKVSSTDYPVLITGETGTGKEMAARAFHELSPRADGPLVIVNCGAIPENLLESELFGHEKGAFTGAVRRKMGKFEAANKGTLFLDEIGELPLDLQVKILRFLQEGTVERLGSIKTMKLDVRIISATNRDISALVERGRFREDLFYRINVISLEMPPLRERKKDIPLLANHFLRQEARRVGRSKLSFSPAAISAMTSYEWPGNVRQLQNTIRRAISITDSPVIQPSDLGIKGFSSSASEYQKLPTLKEARDRAEEEVVRRALSITGNNITQAAKLLGISRPTLHDLLKKHEITIDR